MKKWFKRCPYCGKEIKSKAIKCQYCFKFLEEEKKEKICPFCLNNIDINAKVCPFCDEPFIDDENVCISVNVANDLDKFEHNEGPETEENINDWQVTMLKVDNDFSEWFDAKNIKKEIETEEECDPNYVYKVLFVLLWILWWSFLLIMLMVRIFS